MLDGIETDAAPQIRRLLASLKPEQLGDLAIACGLFNHEVYAELLSRSATTRLYFAEGFDRAAAQLATIPPAGSIWVAVEMPCGCLCVCEQRAPERTASNVVHVDFRRATNPGAA